MSLAQGQQTISLEEFVAREHILVSSGGFIGITDGGLAALGLSRRVCASTTHFAALPRYPIELGWRTSTQLDPLVLKVREAIVASFACSTWQP